MADRETAADAVEVWITGVGLATSLGEGLDAHWEALSEGRINVDTKSFAPFVVHPFAPVAFDAQIPKKGDQRQMEAWQRIGVYAAGLALQSANVKGDKDILSRMDMVVAAGGGERDFAVDSAILDGLAKTNAGPDFLNERLMSDLRPTLFLAQLSNLLAGNIAIVHGVTGSSRTFMGEESSSVDAARIALARILAGTSEIALVGSAHNGERKDLLLLHEFGGLNLRERHTPVWSRGERGGFALGSGGVFLVLESSRHAQARGATPLAQLSRVVADRTPRREAGDVTHTFERLLSELGTIAPQSPIISGATGLQPITDDEKNFLARHPNHPVRASGTRFGHLMEAQFVLGLALAALSLSRGALFPPADSGVEIASTAAPQQIVVTSAGHWRGEGLGLVEAVRR